MATKKATKKAAKKATKKTTKKPTKGAARPGLLDPCLLHEVFCDLPTDPDDHCPACCELGPLSAADHATCAEQIRVEAAQHYGAPPSHPCNGDEACFQGVTLQGEARDCANNPYNAFADRFIASFTKGLPRNNLNNLGEVDPEAYCLLLKALASGDPSDFENVPLCCMPDELEDVPPGCMVGSSRSLENPQSAFAYDLEGANSHALAMRPAPRFESAQEIAEIAENYWMALARDVPFTEYITDPLINAAANDLQQYQCFLGPTNPDDLFRGTAQGELDGPYVSQFLFIDVPYGAQFIPAMIRTVLPGIDYMTAYNEWLAVQCGADRDQSACDLVPRFIRNGRDLGQYVHIDQTFNAFLNAGLILLSGRDPLRRCEARPGMGVEFAQCLPYVNPMAPVPERFAGKSKNQIGMATFGPQHLFSLLSEVMNRALKAVWYQKWAVHRRLRPEEFGGRIHNRVAGGELYPFHAGNFAQLQEDLLPLVFAHNERQNCNRRMQPEEGTYLLPMAYAEGCPLHPAYGAGHATVAGACGTILKAFFTEEQCIINPVVPTPDGRALVFWQGNQQLSVSGEINKLVGNVALGRNFAGVHWRTDYSESIRLGEEVAISILCDQRNTFNEAYEFRFTRFDGQTRVRIRPGNVTEEPCPVQPEEDATVPSGECERTRRPNAPGC